MHWIPGSGRSPEVGNGNSLQYSCLENSIDRGTWRATVHEVATNQTRQHARARAHMHTHTHTHTLVYPAKQRLRANVEMQGWHKGRACCFLVTEQEKFLPTSHRDWRMRKGGFSLIFSMSLPSSWPCSGRRRLGCCYHQQSLLFLELRHKFHFQDQLQGKCFQQALVFWGVDISGHKGPESLGKLTFVIEEGERGRNGDTSSQL